MFTKEKIVHIHPSRLCNFTCAHCYTSSGPGLREGLESHQLLHATRQLKRYGYTHASISGGEPTLYRHLDVLCRGLSAQGYSVSVISNGWNINKIIPLAMEGSIDFVAISVDGTSKLHDRIRGKYGSFRSAESSLIELNKTPLAVGAIIAVTNPTMQELPDLVEHLAGFGLSKIQFHPIAFVGRAKESDYFDLNELEPEALVRLILMTEVFRQTWPTVKFQTDAVFGAQLKYEANDPEDDVVTPLVIDEIGRILPLVHGVNPKYQLGQVNNPIDRPTASSELKKLIGNSVLACSKMFATCYYSNLLVRSYSESQ